MIKLMVVEDLEIFREPLVEYLGNDPDIEVVRTCKDGKEAVEAVCNLDVILMDVRMPNMDGLEATRMIRLNNKKVKIIIWTAHEDQEYIYKAFEYGIEGYAFKDYTPDELLSCIKYVAKGDRHNAIDVRVNRTLQDILKNMKVVNEYVIIYNGLDDIDKKIVKLAASGMIAKDIDEKLPIDIKGTGVRKRLSNVIYPVFDISEHNQKRVKLSEIYGQIKNHIGAE